MSDITRIGEKPDVIFVCTCGCSTWRLLDSGAIECAACDSRGTDFGSWYTKKPDVPPRDETPFSDVQGNGSIEFARARLERMAGDADVKLIAIARKDGSVHLWTDADGRKQVKWALRRLKTAAGLLKKRLRG